jgi:DNA-directed RNA polymerase specialized sigma subunit
MKNKKTDIFKRKKIKEEDFLKALDDISKKLIYKFKFGYHEIEDMKQQAAIFALEGLENYDSSRPLANFLWTHVRNRLFNFKRDNYFRPDNVCVGCPFFDPKYKKSSNQCSQFKEKLDCSIYSESINKNQIKKNIMHPCSIENQHNTLNDDSIFNDVSNNEILGIIEDKIHIKYREIYLKIKGGSKVSKAETLKLKTHIEEILKEHFNE